jgi:hypothetical protein
VGSFQGVAFLSWNQYSTLFRRVDTFSCFLVSSFITVYYYSSHSMNMCLMEPRLICKLYYLLPVMLISCVNLDRSFILSESHLAFVHHILFSFPFLSQVPVFLLEPQGITSHLNSLYSTFSSHGLLPA